MGEMKRTSGNASHESFKYSEALTDEYNASLRRYIRPVLVFLPSMFLGLVIPYQVPALVLLGVGTIVSIVMAQQTFVLQMRLNRRLKAEKREWEAKQRPAGPDVRPRLET